MISSVRVVVAEKEVGDGGGGDAVLMVPLRLRDFMP